MRVKKTKPKAPKKKKRAPLPEKKAAARRAYMKDYRAGKVAGTKPHKKEPRAAPVATGKRPYEGNQHEFFATEAEAAENARRHGSVDHRPDRFRARETRAVEPLPEHSVLSEVPSLEPSKADEEETRAADEAKTEAAAEAQAAAEDETSVLQALLPFVFTLCFEQFANHPGVNAAMQKIFAGKLVDPKTGEPVDLPALATQGYNQLCKRVCARYQMQVPYAEEVIVVAGFGAGIWAARNHDPELADAGAVEDEKPAEKKRAPMHVVRDKPPVTAHDLSGGSSS